MSADRSLEAVIGEWDGEAVATRFDHETGAWFFVAFHDTTLGTPNGGTRMRVYDRPADGLEDAMRLAEGMTRKWAVLGLPFGGGKAVLAVSRWPEGEEREGLLLRYGGFLETLGGSFQTGVDLGTTPEDMLVIGRITRNVHGVEFETGRMIDPGPFTARGVLRGIEAALEAVFGDPSLEGRRVLVQGVGDVGRPLAGFLAERGARLLVSDVDGERAGRVARELSGQVVPPPEVTGHACDVYAPCAVGGVLTRETIPGLACRIVAGSANAQLGEPEDADRLHERGILYAPDYVVNGGGAAAFGLLSIGERDEERILEQVDGIGETLRSIFHDAAASGESPVAAADRRVVETLSRRREAGSLVK
ncbi:MAG TPA: Glu/Leu/Phe/Val dehydrogenase dimerization domain-containing protein [Gemmatimonadota bacterium]|nr:Glu/Leu/Phe/Val dehydrogenase dimerization domain-containing protein [Gemmatimonadota bacterium]